VRPAALAPALVLLGLAACRVLDPQQELAIDDVETHWALDRSKGDTRYLAPVIRFHVRNKGIRVLRAVQATATFRQQGESASWGSDWRDVTPSGKPLQPGQVALVVLKSDARYYSTGPVEGMLAHREWKDANVEVFLRIGPSGWSKFAATGVERRVGARSVQDLAAP
jgi:hypothetical protein